MKHEFIKALAITAFVFLAMLAVSGITDLKMFNAFDPISEALGEYELTDYVFSKFRENPKPDTNIVIVNIAPSRRAVAQQIRIINQYHPRVIGIDSFFNCEGGLTDTVNCPQVLDTLGNLLLSDAIQEAGNVVMVSRLLQTDSLSKSGDYAVYDSIEYSDPMFSDYSYNAFANLPTNATYQDDAKICRSIIPQMKVGGDQEIAFSVAIAMKYDSVKAASFLARKKNEEVINFRGSAEILDVKIEAHRKEANTSDFRLLCYAIDWRDIFQGNFLPAMIQDKVVIIGFMGDYPGDPAWSDKFFTPLNKKVAGRANPDMFGVVVHANVVSMILSEDYVGELGVWMQYGIAILVCILTVMLFIWVDGILPHWFDGLSVMIQVVEIILLSLVTVFVFAWYSFKLDMTIAMAVAALVGPCFDIFKGFENTLLKRLTKSKKAV